MRFGLLTLTAFLAVSVAAYGQNREKVVINFEAVVGDRLFDCKESHEGIGTTASKMTVTDLRFYVENVRLIGKDGRETPVAIENDGRFQTEKVILLDFENGEAESQTLTLRQKTIFGVKAQQEVYGRKDGWLGKDKEGKSLWKPTRRSDESENQTGAKVCVRKR